MLEPKWNWELKKFISPAAGWVTEAWTETLPQARAEERRLKKSTSAPFKIIPIKKKRGIAAP
jgi:hypothetical protein